MDYIKNVVAYIRQYCSISSNQSTIAFIMDLRLQVILSIFISLWATCHGGLVAYSTELERNDKNPYSFSLETYQSIWKYMFLWAFISIFVVHLLASTIATATLRKHKYGKFIGVFILLYGTLSALAVSCVTSAVIAFVLYQAKIELFSIHAMLSGFCQLGVFLFVTFFTLKPTL